MKNLLIVMPNETLAHKAKSILNKHKIRSDVRKVNIKGASGCTFCVSVREQDQSRTIPILQQAGLPTGTIYWEGMS